MIVYCEDAYSFERHSIHSDPESGLLYWVSRVYDDKNLRMTICHRVLILPNEEILASSSKSVPAGEVNLYPRLSYSCDLRECLKLMKCPTEKSMKRD